MDADRANAAGVVGIHHVAFAVADLDAGIEHWTQQLGAQVLHRAVVEAHGVEAAALAWQSPGSELELVAPAPGEAGASSGLQRFLDRRGAGMHHVAWSVLDIGAAMQSLTGAGVEMIDAEPRMGLHGTPVAFVHPRSMDGVLVELVEVPEDAAPGR